MKFDSIRAGNVYYTVSKHRMGNTTMSTVAIHKVKVISCDSVKGTVVASWNGNAARTYHEHEYAAWRKGEPLLIKSGFGHRLATREEIKAAKQIESTTGGAA
jgi:hypothetical protein